MAASADENLVKTARLLALVQRRSLAGLLHHTDRECQYTSRAIRHFWRVLENTESTAWQYALRERAVALGWDASRIVVIDQDLGQSGACAVDREGFQRLVAEVGLGHIGLVMGLEVSRLARSSLDWHHVLEICAMTGTLILDEDGLSKVNYLQ